MVDHSIDADRAENLTSPRKHTLELGRRQRAMNHEFQKNNPGQAPRPYTMAAYSAGARDLESPGGQPAPATTTAGALASADVGAGADAVEQNVPLAMVQNLNMAPSMMVGSYDVQPDHQSYSPG